MSIPRGPTRTRLSPCAELYARWLIDPFIGIDGYHPRAKVSKECLQMELPCVPAFPPIDSRKISIVTRGSFQTGANGGAAIMFAFMRLPNDYSPTYNTNCPILITNTAYPGDGTSFPVVDSWTTLVPGTGCAMVNNASDITSAQMVVTSSPVQDNNGYKMRLVCAGGRVWYNGPLMNMSGTYISCSMPDHSSLNGQTIQLLSALPAFVEQPIQANKKHQVTWQPVWTADYEYLADGIVNAGIIALQTVNQLQGQYQLNHSSGISITGGPANTSFMYEMIQVVELIGQSVTSKTKSQSDPNGLASVANVVNPTTSTTLQKNVGKVESLIEQEPMTINGLVDIAQKGVQTFEKLAPLFLM